MKLRTLAFTLLLPALLLRAVAAHADATLSLDNGTVWQTLKTGENTQGFLQIHNTGDAADMLTAVTCTIAAATVLVDASGKAVPSLDIPAGQTVTFSGTGPHLLINAARYKILKGGLLPCAFTFAQSGTLVGYLNAVPPPAHD